jgi:hypothetical protein
VVCWGDVQSRPRVGGVLGGGRCTPRGRAEEVVDTGLVHSRVWATEILEKIIVMIIISTRFQSGD